MPLSAIITGASLLSLGPIFYLLIEPGQRHFTAFIPSFFGLIILIFGLVATNPARTKMAMHGAVGFAMVSALGALFMGGPKWPALLSGQLTFRPMAALAMLVMFVICAIFVGMSVGQFIRMRSPRR